jgi:hypothetical protein
LRLLDLTASPLCDPRWFLETFSVCGGHKKTHFNGAAAQT